MDIINMLGEELLKIGQRIDGLIDWAHEQDEMLRSKVSEIEVLLSGKKGREGRLGVAVQLPAEDAERLLRDYATAQPSLGAYLAPYVLLDVGSARDDENAGGDDCDSIGIIGGLDERIAVIEKDNNQLRQRVAALENNAIAASSPVPAPHLRDQRSLSRDT